ncbi:MAG: hypothetical protein R3D59_17660 [Paracoccaceae bacterium]
MPRATATRAAAAAGRGSPSRWACGQVVGNPFLLLIAFSSSSAGAERADEALKTLARGPGGARCDDHRIRGADPDDSLDAAASALIRTTQHEFPVSTG